VKQEAMAAAADTVGAAIKHYLADVAPKRQRPRSLVQTNVYLNRYWSGLHSYPISRVPRMIIAKRIGEIAKEHGPIAANRSRQTLSAFFGWALREGYCETNPVTATNRAVEEKSRDRVLTDDELRAIWQACGDDDFGRIVKLLMLT